MIFNRTYRMDRTLNQLGQDEIYNTPEFYAMSAHDIINSGRCPEHLKEILEFFPWSDRPNVVQVRPQDFREKDPEIKGRGWHVDVNTVLMNGTEHVAKNLDEFRSMVVSFGRVLETEFVRDPIDIPDFVNPYNHGEFAGYVASKHPPTIVAAPEQIAVYTGRDIHRAGPTRFKGRMRLIIVAFECDEAIPREGGVILPSILERDLAAGATIVRPPSSTP